MVGYAEELRDSNRVLRRRHADDLNPERIVRTLSTLLHIRNVNNNAEITIEGNPGTLNAEKLRALSQSRH